MTGLSPNHGRRIGATFAHLNRLLCDIEQVVNSPSSPFSDEQPDLTEVEARLLIAVVASVRTTMLAALDRLGLPQPRRRTSARWSAEVAFDYVDIALMELTPEAMKGYGDIDPALAVELAAVIEAIRSAVATARSVLRPVGGDLRARLRSLAGSAGVVLRKMEEVTADLGLASVRPLISAAADRAEATELEVGVFGRVSAGKSSLINALVGELVLPVGATPVSAVPVRVVHGLEERRVTFLDGREEVVGAAELATFATEHGNAGNRRQVRSILIRSPVLQAGLALLDTPGVGSLSHSGPAQTFAWLPRCDVGLVLVGAGTPLGRDEIALVTALERAGIGVHVLLSKCDLIPADERAAAGAYVQAELQAVTGGERINVHPVSTIDAAAALLEHWRAQTLAPLVARRRVTAEVALARRIRALFQAMCAALAARPGFAPGELELQRSRAAALHDVEVAVRALAIAGEAAVARAADAAATAWRNGLNAQTAVRRALVEEPARVVSAVRAAVQRVFTTAGDPGGQEAAPGDDAETSARLPPLFDPPLLDNLPIQRTPGLCTRLAPRLAAARALAPCAPAVHDAYQTYANRVRAWGFTLVEEAFARVGALRDGPASEVPPALRPLAALVEETFPPLPA